jgi:phage FluMu protein Com
MIEINGEDYRELRCAKCRKLICYERVIGKICYICPRCNEVNSFNFTGVNEWRKNDKIKLLKIYKKDGEK